MSKIATVQYLIEFLKENFSPDDKLCFFDEGGAWCELVHAPNDMFGDMFFKYVKDKKSEELRHLSCRKEDEEHLKQMTVDSYKQVEENGVVIF